MGVDLTLFPLYSGSLGDRPFSVSCLETDRNYALQEDVRLQNPIPLHVGFSSYIGVDGVWSEETKDAYGSPLTYLAASNLVFAFKKAKAADPHFGPENTAILRFLEALPPNWKVVLWWH